MRAAPTTLPAAVPKAFEADVAAFCMSRENDPVVPVVVVAVGVAMPAVLDVAV
jgi:hypothetical protein